MSTLKTRPMFLGLESNIWQLTSALLAKGLGRSLAVKPNTPPRSSSAALLWNIRLRWERGWVNPLCAHALSTDEQRNDGGSEADEDMLEPLETSCPVADPLDEQNGLEIDVAGVPDSLDSVLQSVNFDEPGDVDFVVQSFPGNHPVGSTRKYSVMSELGETEARTGPLKRGPLFEKNKHVHKSGNDASKQNDAPRHILEPIDLSGITKALDDSDGWDGSFSTLDRLLEPQGTPDVGRLETVETPTSRKRTSGDAWGLDNSSFKRVRGSGSLHDVVAEQKVIAERMKVDAPHKHDLSFLDPIDINKESEQLCEIPGEDLWLFDEAKEKDGEKADSWPESSRTDASLNSADFTLSPKRSEKSAAQTKRFWSRTYAGQGAFIRVDSMLGLVERKIVRMVRDDLLDCLVAEAGQDSPSATFISVMRESTNKNKKVGIDRLDKLCVLLQERLPHLTPEELAITLLCMARVGYRNNQILREFWTHIISSNMLSSCGPRVLASFTLASGLLNHLHVKASEAIELEVLKLVDSPACFSNFNASAFTGLLFGCSLAWSKKSGRVLVGGLVGCECSDARFWHRSEWIDLASMLSLSGAYHCTPKQLVRKLYSKIVEGCDKLGAPETVLLLQGLHQVSNKQRDRAMAKLVAKCVKPLMDHVQTDGIVNSLESSLVPDLVHIVSFLEKPGMKLMGRMSQLLAKDKRGLPMWILIRKVLEGYSRLCYVDDGVFRVLNTSLLYHGFTNMHVAPLAKLLMSGWSLQALNENVVDKIVLALQASNPAWNRCTPISAAKTAWGLAALRKLTPEILTICAERCKDMESADIVDPTVNWNAESNIGMRGLFTGYHFIHSSHGPATANACFPGELLDRVLKFTELVRLEAVGKANPVQRQISKELEELGLSNTLKPLLGKALYEADIALHDKQVVLLVDKSGARSVNAPFRLLGPALLRQQQLEDLKIQVVRIQESDWKTLSPDKRGNFLEAAFEKEGIDIKKMAIAAKRNHKRRLKQETEPIGELFDMLPRWTEDRILITRDLAKNRLKDLADTRGIFNAEEDVVIDSVAKKLRTTKRKSTRRKKQQSKISVVSAVVALEASSLFRQIQKELDS